MYEFRPAVREKTSLLIALAGPSGSGKTFSALQLAKGLAGAAGKIAYIDTEARRALHYADQFAFDHCDFAPPFRPDRYREVIEGADGNGYDVIVLDSMSHEWSGEGGIIDWQDEEVTRMAGDNWQKREAVKMAAWIKPKTSHKRMVSRLLQCRAHLIFCLRAEEKMLMSSEVDEQTGRKKTVIVPAQDRPLLERWQPICEKNFMYEQTLSFLLLPDRPGVPHFLKLQAQHRGAFPDSQAISAASGEALREWANGGKAPRHEKIDAMALAEDAARKGKDAFTAFWNSDVGKTHRGELRPHLDTLTGMAREADGEAPESADETPFAEPTKKAPPSLQESQRDHIIAGIGRCDSVRGVDKYLADQKTITEPLRENHPALYDAIIDAAEERKAALDEAAAA